MTDFIVRGNLEEIDHEVFELIQCETERQIRKLIMIPSESTAPSAIREALGSTFQNLYAEGYPDEETRWMEEAQILDYATQLTHYRRYADPRYYKGVEYADMIESLARRRCAESFATEKIPASQIYVNVQALSGAPANNAVYSALINPGDTILGMNLLHGGHLTHGSSVNRSGKLYKVIHYSVSPETGQIDYDAIQALASDNKPKIIIAGYSSYPWKPDWVRFRAIADSIGAFLLADISHIAGLVAAGTIPSPVGHAHVITFTTHKTLCGPRGACILTTDGSISKKIDKAVFPGEQGGPHVHVFAAMAAAFKLAQLPQFKALQDQIINNCQALTTHLQKRGLVIAFGGSDTHLVNIDCKTIKGVDGTYLSGDMAARVLDLAGIVTNRNTIPGDKSALQASGIRLGTPWVTQRGLKEQEMVKIADIIADLFQAIKPYQVETRQGLVSRAKIDFKVLENAKLRVNELVKIAGSDAIISSLGYPHYYSLLDSSNASKGDVVIEMKSSTIRHFVNYCFDADVESLISGTCLEACLWTPVHVVNGILQHMSSDIFHFKFNKEDFGLVSSWLRNLSDGYVEFDSDVTRRIPGPVIINQINPEGEFKSEKASTNRKPYYIGIQPRNSEALPDFKWVEREVESPRKTPLNACHKELGAKMVPFAGWEMPVWYSSVVEEHLATRKTAGLFDVSHMGVFQAEGPDAVVFLDSVCGNDINGLAVGESCYTQFLDPYANVIDDTLIYRRGVETYLVVVNASNDDKDWAWLNSVKDGKVLVDTTSPDSIAFGRNVTLRNLRDPKEGQDMRVDIALQGPKSRDCLLALGCDSPTRKKVLALKRTELCEAVIGGFDLVISRTGYTGEKMAFELFVHPDKAPDLWNALLKAGEPMGIKPCGLGARDSLRTEAGLPLYGHEMAGELGLGVAEAGFGSYVKVYKPWFIGREAYLKREQNRKEVVVRFRFDEKAVRMAHLGDPVVDQKGYMIGKVTSCAIDTEGYLTGQAVVEKKAAQEGTPIAIYQGATNLQSSNPAELKIGEKIALPTPAKVISRFPRLI